MKNQKYRNTKKSNQGFSLFTVIVAVSFVGILGFLVLYIALSNFQMKVTDLKAKDSFYTAERALEEVRTGLQEDVGEAMSSAYIKVLETYSKNSDNEGVTNGATLDEIRQAEFKKLFLEELGGRLQKAGDNTQYDIDIINDYLDMEELGVIDSAEETLIVTNPTGKLPVMAKDLSSGIVLRNLKCIYVDQFGRAAIIETDIRLGIPRVQFPTPSTLPDLMNMIVVANSGVICPTGDATKQTVIQGSIYAGLPGGTNENNSIKVEPNAHLSISEGNYVVCQGKIDVADGGSFRNAGPASLWARGIDVTSGEITLIGKTYLADDLTVRSGSGSKVTIEGEYYGYGNPDSALKDGCLNKEMYQGASATDISSAIVINGRNTTMDLSRVSKLMLAGKNYIASSKIPPREGEASNENIMTGESLTVKGTQLAYLVPEELLSANGKPVSNPMSFVDYPSDGVVTDWDKPVEEWGGKTLREIGVDSVQEVFYNDNSSDGYLYFYLNFTDDTRAAAFMQMYYTNNPQVKKKMDKYLGFYFGEDSGIKVNSGQSFLRYITNGNVLAYDGSSQSRSLNSATDTQVGAQSIQEQIKFQNTWYSLNRKMLGSTDLLKTDVKESEGVTHDETLSTRTVFDNLVNETKMVNFITANGVNNEFRHPMPEDEGGLEAVMLNNENGNAFHITSSEAQKLRLLVCTGDVVIEPDVKFQGIIMAKGSITLGSGAQLISSPMEAAKVFQSQITQEYEGKIISPKDFFWEGDKYVLGNALADKEQTGGTKISDFYDLAECVTYENWKKK